MKRIGVVCNLERKEIAGIVSQLLTLIERQGGRVCIHPEDAKELNRDDLALSTKSWPDTVDFAVSLGGDGTLLRTARLLAGTGLPILGVNLGRLGFLTEVEVTDLPSRLPRILSGQYVIDERMMLDVHLERIGTKSERFLALNDAVIGKGTSPGTIDISVKVSGEEAGSYRADGVIISTPTGSTAYSLSAGGPVICPNLNLFVITPICPHSFYARSMVVSATDSVYVDIKGKTGDSVLSIDGQQGHPVVSNDTIFIRRASAVTRLIRSTDHNFYRVVKQKLKEPGR